MENVKNLLSDKHRHNFNEWFKVLESMGYTNYYKVLNAKDYGIPQNRERIFCVSILGGGQYLFPNPIPLEKKLKDMLDDNVDEKYYLRKKTLDYFERKNKKQKEISGHLFFKPIEKTKKYINCITAGYNKLRTTETYIKDDKGIRKLTPKECWRFMGVKDEQFNLLNGISDEQLYKMAGNSIVVDVLEAIFKNLLMPETTDTKGQLTLF